MFLFSIKSNERFLTRGAFDVGTGGSITWTIASLYPRKAILRKEIFHSSLHLPPNEEMIQSNMITTRGIASLESTFFQIFGRLDESRMRPHQMAAIVAEPFSNAYNAKEVFDSISRRFFIFFKLANRPEMEHYAHLAYVAGSGLSLHLAHQAIIWAEVDDRVIILRRNSAHASPESPVSVDTWDTKYTPQDIHDTILTSYQNRKIIQKHDGEFNSVNPLSSVEIRMAVDDLTKAFRLSMPTWLCNARQHANANDRLFCGASSNGGIINSLSRSCNKTDIDIYTARSSLYSTYTGASDEFLARSFPVPRLVLPKLIIAHALINALGLRFLRYLPHTNPSYGILFSKEFFSDMQSSESYASCKESIRFMEKPWKALSGNPHVSQHLAAHTDSLLSSKSARKKHY